MTESLTPEQQSLKDELVRIQGAWGEDWETALRFDSEFMRTYLGLAAVPWKKSHLDAKTKTLCKLAVDAAATGLYIPGVQEHIRTALRLGTTAQEIMETLELTATVGIHAMNIGVPILTEVLVERGLRTGPAPLTEYQEQLKNDFIATRGYWHSFFDEMLELDPEMFEAYLAFSGHPWRHGTLSPKVKELIYIAFDCAATHLYVKGLKLHIENAIGYGATKEEILEVMELASTIGIHAVTVGASILAHALAERDG